jgi:LacI family transcriptional regulator
MISFSLGSLTAFRTPARWQLPTINDVARQAGVSTVTVSRVLNNAPNVNAATRQRIEEAIQELGYVPNVAARSLRSKRTRSLALILPDITNSFWTTVARGVEDAAQSSGYSVLLCNTDESSAKQLRYLELVASRRVDGVIIAPFDSDVQNIRTLRDREIATVLIDRRIDGWETDSVLGDSVGGARALVRHLIGLGHARIAMISGPLITSTAQDRVDGYCAALMEAGIDPDPALIRRGEFRASSGEQLMGQLLDEGLHPTAVFAANNAIAMGVIDAAVRRGLRIPRDLALVCFDDFDAASHLFPFLTVAVQPAYEMGVRAAELLLHRVEAGAALAPRHLLLPTRLVIRHSCGSHLQNDSGSDLSLPLAGVAEARTVLVGPSLPDAPGRGDGDRPSSQSHVEVLAWENQLRFRTQ